MRYFLTVVVATILLAGCSKSDSGGGSDASPAVPDATPVPPVVAPPPSEGTSTGGTIVGNGGGDVPLKFTLIGLKSFDYWNLKTAQHRKSFEQCGLNLRKEEDPLSPWTEIEWQELLLKKCGSEPQPRIAYFDSVDRALKLTKLFLSDTFNCGAENICGGAWQAFPKEMKIYISPTKWGQLSEQDKVRETLLAYDSLVVESQKNKIDKNLEIEVFRKVFQVNFSMDVFRNFIDDRKMLIIEDGAQVYAQEKIVAQMSMAMDCFRLVDKRFPNQVNVKNISLIEKYSFLSGDQDRNRSLVEFGYTNVNLKEGSTSKLGIRTTDKTLYLGRNTSLQKCYNSMVPMGLKNPLIEMVDAGQVAQKPILKPPMTGDSELVLEFINIAFKALDFVVQDQKKMESRYQQCLKDNGATGSQICQPSLLKSADLDAILDIFPTIEVQETDAKLCTNNLPNCSDQDALAAINRPADHQIIFNRTKWKALAVSDKIQLALHEVFGIVGLEINDYHLSAHFAPMIYIESFSIDFFADEITSFLIQRKIFPLHVGDFYEHIQYQDRAVLLMDCLNLVEQRHPGRLSIGMVSLNKNDSYSWSGLEVAKNMTSRILGTNYLSSSNTHKDYLHLLDIGKDVLYLDAGTTLQQCYNKVVAQGLKN